MANASKYTYSKDTPYHDITGYFPGAEGILFFETRRTQGLTPFGPQGGVLTEDSLTDGIVDFLMSKTDEDGTKTYEKYLVKKGKEKAVAG